MVTMGISSNSYIFCHSNRKDTDLTERHSNKKFILLVFLGMNVTGPPGALLFDVKPQRIERITRTAVLDDLPFGAFIAQFSCNSCHT